MSLSDRFENIPAPRYDTMEIKANGTTMPRSNVASNAPNIIYDEAIIASEPQIIRPNVSNLILSKKQPQPQTKNNKNNQKNQKNKTNRNSGDNNNNMKRNQNKKGNNNRSRGFNGNANTNRARGYRSNNNVNFQTNSFQTQQNGFHTNFNGNGGYKSFRTSNTQPRNPMNHTPYRRPQKQPPKVRQLPTYQNYTNGVYNRSKSNGFNRNQNQNTNGYNNGYNGYNNNSNAQSFNNNPYLYNKRQNYYNQRNNNNTATNNRFMRNNNNNNNNKPRNTIGNRNRTGNKGSSFQKKTDSASLDRELDAYNMKNPNVEDRNYTISANLDKELDDYFNSQSDENATSSNQHDDKHTNSNKE